MPNRSIYCSVEEWRAFAMRAAEAGLSLNAWLRRAGVEQAALEAALRRQEERERDDEGGS